jgi:hypothetical protein
MKHFRIAPRYHRLPATQDESTRLSARLVIESRIAGGPWRVVSGEYVRRSDAMRAMDAMKEKAGVP